MTIVKSDSNNYDKYIWDIDTENTTDVWVPVMNKNLIQHRTIEINTTYVTTRTIGGSFPSNVDNTQVTAPTVPGYSFVCWISCASNGWVGLVYPDNVTASTTNLWTNRVTTNGIVNHNDALSFYATALYRKS